MFAPAAATSRRFAVPAQLIVPAFVSIPFMTIILVLLIVITLLVASVTVLPAASELPVQLNAPFNVPLLPATLAMSSVRFETVRKRVRVPIRLSVLSLLGLSGEKALANARTFRPVRPSRVRSISHCGLWLVAGDIVCVRWPQGVRASAKANRSNCKASTLPAEPSSPRTNDLPQILAGSQTSQTPFWARFDQCRERR
jgi:hypothetical protein